MLCLLLLLLLLLKEEEEERVLPIQIEIARVFLCASCVYSWVTWRQFYCGLRSTLGSGQGFGLGLALAVTLTLAPALTLALALALTLTTNTRGDKKTQPRFFPQSSAVTPPKVDTTCRWQGVILRETNKIYGHVNGRPIESILERVLAMLTARANRELFALRYFYFVISFDMYVVYLYIHLYISLSLSV